MNIVRLDVEQVAAELDASAIDEDGNFSAVFALAEPDRGNRAGGPVLCLCAPRRNQAQQIDQSAVGRSADLAQQFRPPGETNGLLMAMGAHAHLEGGHVPRLLGGEAYGAPKLGIGRGEAFCRG